MSDYLAVATNPILYVVTLILLSIVFGQAFIFIRMTLKQARQYNVSADKIKTAAKAAAATTVVPSLATVIALITMAPILGLAFSWARLSVIGSLGYELMAAEVGATAAGTSLNSDTYGASAFLASVFAMTAGSTPALFYAAFFYKSYKKKVSAGITRQGDQKLSNCLMSAMMIGLYVPLIMEPVMKGGTGLVTIIASGVAMVVLNWLIRKFRIKWLNNFALSISMIAGMAAAILVSL